MPVGHLTIFSEDGDKFFLILNGERQNNVAQTNLRVEDLNQPYFSAKVIFEDKSLGELDKKFLPITDESGIYMDVTYKIKRNKNTGKMSLNYFSMVPVQQNFRAPANVAVVHWGAPVAPVPATTVVTQTPGVVTQTTTTTTTTGTGGAVGANVNIGGINMGVTITDPLMDVGMQTTTTTTRSSTTIVESNPVVGQPVPVQPVGCFNRMPMAAGDFNSAVATIRNQGFDETRLNTARQIASSNCLSTNQITQICQIFGFEQTKLDFAKFAYDYCTDRNNYFKVNNIFSFSSSSDELNSYIQGR